MRGKASGTAYTEFTFTKTLIGGEEVVEIMPGTIERSMSTRSRILMASKVRGRIIDSTARNEAEETRLYKALREPTWCEVHDQRDRNLGRWRLGYLMVPSDPGGVRIVGPKANAPPVQRRYRRGARERRGIHAPRRWTHCRCCVSFTAAVRHVHWIEPMRSCVISCLGPT